MIKIGDLPTIAELGLGLVAGKPVYRPTVASFEVTNRCTLRCRHRYWWRRKPNKELSEDKYYQKIKEVKKRHPSLIAAMWLGGEPLLRKEIVEKGSRLFSFNEVITNGTIPLPYWPDFRFACSVDGTKKYHELQRGTGTYDKIKKNINRGDLNVNIICILTRPNQECLENFVEEWSKSEIKSIGFGFYTPVGSDDDEKIWIDFKERDLVLERILKLKEKYPRFINLSLATIRGFNSKNCRENTNVCRNSLAPFCSMCFDSKMIMKFPCIIGDRAQCDKCGCGGSVVFENIRSGDFSMFLQHLPRIND